MEAEVQVAQVDSGNSNTFELISLKDESAGAKELVSDEDEITNNSESGSNPSMHIKNDFDSDVVKLEKASLFAAKRYKVDTRLRGRKEVSYISTEVSGTGHGPNLI